MIVLGPGVTIPESELAWKTSRSGGPGGQNVNKVETRVELVWDVGASPSLSEHVRARLLAKWATRLSDGGRLRLVVDTERSQRRNRDLALERLKDWVQEALKRTKVRRPTRPSRGSQERRIAAKKRRGESKRNRLPPEG